MVVVWKVNQQQMELGRGKRSQIWGGAFLLWVCLMLATPKIPLSHHTHQQHLFADMRNFLGVPNTLNVITNFPFLLVGVVGFVLSVHGCFFNIREIVSVCSLRGEVWGWALYFGGIVCVAFGSAYYHLKPDDSRVMYDTLPIVIAYSSLFSSFIVERVGQKAGLSWLFGLLLVALLSAAYARTFNDLRLCMMFQLIPCAAIPAISILGSPKYTHSKYWLWAGGVCLFAKLEAALDRKLYHANRYFISGHSLEHLCTAVVPILLTVMLMRRNLRFQRYKISVSCKIKKCRWLLVVTAFEKVSSFLHIGLILCLCSP
ncbi:hypothetical protein Tsubulata_014698 [Turnera subulata]|uniref:Alkaline phytoceramidase n=1 Tax=Turnera subulata TaxID=218843 RepID=A0A9Q0FLN4_9ROSI|nr:hypothetical protein Tsubulata_014698 [Turnera subulata]